MPAPLLLVSVINVTEAQAALQGKADLIDIKNPAQGPLGAPYPPTIRAICAALANKRPTSAAIGEFPGRSGAAALAALGAAYCGPDYLKVAFLGSALEEEILLTLQEIQNGLASFFNPPPRLVAVAYADTLSGASWNLEDFAQMAKEGGAAGCLLDTWEKKGTSLPEILPSEAMQSFIASCQCRQLFCGLAGSLRPAQLPALAALGPDIIGVRSAACGGDRLRGQVTAERVSYLKALLSQAPKNPGQSLSPALPPRV